MADSRVHIYFFRHGETDYNRRGIVQGGGVDSDLNDLGRQQAEAFFKTYAHLTFDAVYASKLKRTQQTLGPWVDSGYSFETHAGLNELSWGVHEGVVPTPEQRKEFLGILSKWSEGQLDLRVPEGESPIEAWDRAKSFFEEIAEKHAGQRILVCSHGRQLRVILSSLLGTEMREMERYKHDNTALSIVKFGGDGPATLELLNDTSHLNFN
ncbi:histidine phosphatase family protein [Pontibacter sp. G13]|uniref:histidine phosphatase family protein n=1 Tax=Pontibacter sp. G13 TaxID=3074898 RepID=UPI00288AAE70|nr:histidine phosphatase family protein [Pontibacter sp. G13]WNJ18641.1 histidine phosphatase family protein [Pontibacter sp. G13]